MPSDTAAVATPDSSAVALTPAALGARLAEEAKAVKAELDEIELLISQAKTEAARHESRRAAAAEKLLAAAGGASGANGAASNGTAANGAGNGAGKEVADLANQLVTVARKAALMEAQVDLLEGKRKSIARLHDVLARDAAEVAALHAGGSDASGVATGNGSGSGGGAFAGHGSGGALEALDADARLGGGEGTIGALDVAEGGAVPPGVARIVLSAQEDLRREIARAMHDGPAQSLTNIVLQAQIVERLVAKDPAAAATEVHALTAMVQRTLDATKTFIFDVRPMVLDDLGLVPTLRRATRDRGARARVKVEFESVGVDRRLSADLESGLFRMLDDALAAHVAGRPERLALHLDWGEQLVIELTAGKTMVEVEKPDLPEDGAELPPALAAMVEERRSAYAAALEAARVESLARLPDRVWREIAERSALLGIQAELLDEGARLRLTVPLPAA
jgi:signal transduction histidine kinase